MIRIRNKLLILTALLTVGLVAAYGVSNAQYRFDYPTGSTPPAINPATGEPEVTGLPIKTTAVAHGATNMTPGNSTTRSVPRTLWMDWAFKIWAATFLRGGP